MISNTHKELVLLVLTGPYGVGNGQLIDIIHWILLLLRSALLHLLGACQLVDSRAISFPQPSMPPAPN